jgi:hypothetical protein
MFKQLSICAALIAIGMGAASAQQQEAVLEIIQLPAAGFDIVFATPRKPGTTIELGRSPEALVVPLIGGELALSFENEEQMLTALECLQYPVGAFQIPGRSSSSLISVAVYAISKNSTIASKPSSFAMTVLAPDQPRIRADCVHPSTR